MSGILFNLQIMAQIAKPQFIEADKLIGLKPLTTQTSIDLKDSILYALSIGFSRDPLRQEDYKYTNQFHPQFTLFPTVALALSKSDLLSPLLESKHVPYFSAFQMLHAEQKLTFIKPKIKFDVNYEHDRELIDCVDKGKNALILFKGTSYQINPQGHKEVAFESECLLFFKGLGGFNSAGKGLIKKPVELPKRKADWVLTGRLFPNQAFLYRLTFDVNPLHIDPEIAKLQKYDKPIIHGLATYGTVARVVVQELLNNDPTRLKAIQTRFVGHVFPGETLDISVWRQGQILIYEAKVQERGVQALIGYIEPRPSANL